MTRELRSSFRSTHFGGYTGQKSDFRGLKDLIQTLWKHLARLITHHTSMALIGHVRDTPTKHGIGPWIPTSALQHHPEGFVLETVSPKCYARLMLADYASDTLGLRGGMG